MLQMKMISIQMKPLADGRFFLYALNPDGHWLDLSDWRHLLFNRHKESYYGTMLESATEDGINGVVISSWQLVTLFAEEGFNRIVDWEWDELSHLCLASAHAVYDAILEKDWHPDFRMLDHAGDLEGDDASPTSGTAAAPITESGSFRWALPEQVKDEFGDNFWEDVIHQDGQDWQVERFISDLFHYALDAYFDENETLKYLLGEKLELLRNNQLSGRELAAYFDEARWLEWLGIKENPAPFSIGLRLEEPEDGEGDWQLGLFLRGHKNGMVIEANNYADYPANWDGFHDKVDAEEQRLAKVFPWLAEEGERGGDDVRLKSALSEEDAWQFLTETSETLIALGIEILLPSWWEAIKTSHLKVKARLKSQGGYRRSFVGLNALLDYDWRFSMNGVDLTEDEFQNLVNEKRRLVFVRGKWIKLDHGFIRQIQDLMKKADKEGLHIRDLLQQELNEETDEPSEQLDDPRAFAKIQIELNRHWKQMMKQLSETKEIPDQPVPAGLQGELRPYQKLGMNWLLFLRKYGFGAVLADDMGLGKTIQLISYLLSVKEQESRSGPALIICPTSVLGNWQKEIERFAPGTDVMLHYGSTRLKGEELLERTKQADIVLTSYGLTHLDSEELEPVEWSAVAIDEAQNIKNADTKQSRAVRKLKGLHHIALTGTPMENRLSELWSIFDFTNRGYLGSAGQFQKRFIVPIEKDGESEPIRQLQGLIRPFLLRRTKKDEDVALNLPDKIEQKEYCPLTAEQASLYEQLVKDTFGEIEKLSGFERKGLILQMLGRLKQLCNHPALYLKEEQPTSLVARSAKMEKLMDLVGAVREQDESCLIFTQYIGMGEMIRKVLQEEFGVDVPFLHGSLPKAKRDQLIDQFQNREFPFFLLSLKAGGTGLNLTAANHVIHYDRWWNPAVENQATDRAYRIGQDRFVHVHKLIATGTLEEKIDAMLEKKQNLNDQIIQSDSWMTELSTDELQELVRLG
ncbi:Superfamily II DNA or RNA helicase, SNF2 family [Mesobacillus persicus]|uniref:Superfamily II DNA or RNA helicase, SNF2 family n=1 Tax=Mesobacillus persicus TaxID=930146 RepID=A0A1H8H2Y1_9BACI|nr:DEAD/DEAH box helicase [Mesobacillus persicus]SEN49828.1 Superfamily II DNA or RNA helicase, SNF2 family [Mesobacillus persicus]